MPILGSRWSPSQNNCCFNGRTILKTTPGATWDYIWDIENRLTEIRKDGVTVATYTYDPFGRRLSKTVFTNGIGKTTWFAYADEGLVAEFNADGNVAKTYGYYPGSTWTTNPLYMWSKEESTGGRLYWYLNDHLGTPKALIDETGVTVWSATSEAFGKTTAAAGSAVTNNLRFPGQYEDGESGEHYNYNRYYGTKTGRYESGDPIGLRGGINLYGYSRNNPLKYYDPDGRAYFATRPLDGSGGEIGEVLIPPWGVVSDLSNTALVHEHLFFEDGKTDPANTGFFSDGIRNESPALITKYTRRDGGYKDCVMRKAYQKVKKSGLFIADNYNLLLLNCQDYATTLRVGYLRLKLEGYDCSESEEPEECQ